MSLRKCPECGNLISSDVKQCIHCGKKLLDSGRLIGGIIIALFLALLLFMVLITTDGGTNIPFISK